MIVKKICVVGAGKWGQNHIRTLNELGNLYGVVESNPDTLKQLKLKYKDLNCFTNLGDAIKFKFDGFVVATPAETHYELAKDIIESKNHVLVEKPITHRLEDAVKLNKLAKENDVNLMVGHLLLFHPAFVKIKNMIDNGEIGDLQYMYSNRLNLGTIRTEENVLWSLAPHDIALFQYFSGLEPLEITSSGNDIVQANIHDTSITSIKYPNKIMGHIFVSWLHPFKEHRFVIIGSKGMIHFEDSSKDKPLIFYDKNISWEEDKPVPRISSGKNIEYDFKNPLTEELKYFISCLDGKPVELVNGDNALEVMKILTKASSELFKG